MGYRTSYNLTIFDKKTHEAIDDFEIIEKIEEFYGVNLSEDNKWYDHVQDMTKFSKKYPKFYFYFANYGEDQCDIWVSLFHNGKQYNASLEPLFPTLNELIGSLK